MTRLLICFCAILFLVPAPASAGPRFGIEGGGSLVWTEHGYDYDEIDLDDTYDYEPRFEFSGAATVQFEFTPSWGLITGLRYSRLGNDVVIENLRSANEPYGDGISGTTTLRQQYLGIPVLARLSFGGDRGLYLFGGAEVAWLIKAEGVFKYDEEDGGGTPSGSTNDITDSMKRYNVTAVIGAGYELGVGDHGLEVAVRYGYGLTDFAEGGSLFSGHMKRKTRELTLTVGFRL